MKNVFGYDGPRPPIPPNFGPYEWEDNPRKGTDPMYFPSEENPLKGVSVATSKLAKGIYQLHIIHSGEGDQSDDVKRIILTQSQYEKIIQWMSENRVPFPKYSEFQVLLESMGLSEA
jgi:hypothetical protein